MPTAAKIQLLDWDSNFFGFSVAKILLPNFAADQLSEALGELRHEGAKLGYWTVDELPATVAGKVAALGGFPCPLRLTYEIEIPENPPAPSSAVLSYPGPGVEPALHSLALASGEYSRFRLDPRLPKGKFEDLYSLWIENSVSRKICEDVLVFRNSAGIVGLVTVGREGKVGKVGLVAVTAAYRGQGVGTELMRAANFWFRAQGLTRASVATQSENEGAGRLYQKSGYHLARKQHTFHFWL